MVARARRRAQGRTATSQPAERALRGRGPLMLDTVVAVPLWVLLAGSALCLLIAILIAVYLRHTLHQSARFAGERGAHDTHEIGRAHVWTPVTNAHLVCRLLLEKKKQERHNLH